MPMTPLPISPLNAADIASPSPAARTSTDEASRGDFHATLAREMGVAHGSHDAAAKSSTHATGEKATARTAHDHAGTDKAAGDGSTASPDQASATDAAAASAAKSKGKDGDTRSGDTAAAAQAVDPAAAARAHAAAAEAATRPEAAAVVPTTTPVTREAGDASALATTSAAERTSSSRGTPLQANVGPAVDPNAGQDAAGAAADLGTTANGNGANLLEGAPAATNFAAHLEQARELIGQHHVADPAAPAGTLPQAAQSALTQAANEPPPAPVVPTSSTLAEPFGSARWGDAFAQRVVLVAGSDSHSAELQLNPPDLGPVQVVIDVQKDQASAWFTSPDPGVRQAIEDSLPRLRELMAQSGIRLDNASVGSESRSSGGNAWQRSTPSWGREAGISASISAPAAARRIVANGLVDTFA